MSQPLDENWMVREYGSEPGAEHASRIQACGCGRNLMVAAVQLARMACTQRQRSGGSERGEAHVGGRGAVGWSGIVGIACASGET